MEEVYFILFPLSHCLLIWCRAGFLGFAVCRMPEPCNCIKSVKTAKIPRSEAEGCCEEQNVSAYVLYHQHRARSWPALVEAGERRAFT